MRQEVFSFNKIENLEWTDFICSSENSNALGYLSKWPDWSNNGLIICGNSGVGKTHLAALWAQSANAIYILKESLNNDPRKLFEYNCNFVLDNFDDFLFEKNFDWLFHFFNIAKEREKFFLILSREFPTNYEINLADLKSRLLMLPIFKIEDPEDDLLIKVAKKLSKDFEMVIDDNAIEYIVSVVERRVDKIREVLKILDKLSLEKRKSITLNFVKKYL